MKKQDVNKQIKRILKAKSVMSLEKQLMPSVRIREYYFVSYAHDDFRFVYADMLRLQQYGVPLWYDTALLAGKDWELLVGDILSRNECKGAIFYLSENSLKSKAVDTELQLALKNGKPVLSVNLPCRAKEHVGEVLSGEELSDLCTSSEKSALVGAVFNKNVIYLNVCEDAEDRAERILEMHADNLFEYEYKDGRGPDGSYGRCAVLSGVRNAFETRITLPSKAPGGEPVVGIGPCAFAGKVLLEEVVLPSTVREIDNSAFYGCMSLKQIDLQNVTRIGSYAFAKSGLEVLNLPKVPCKIEEGAFSRTQIKNLTLRAGALFGERVFERCALLERIILEEGISHLPEKLFVDCNGIRFVSLPATFEVFERAVFNDRPVQIALAEGNPHYRIEGDCLVENSGVRLAYGWGRQVPKSVSAIGRSAYLNVTGISSLCFPAVAGIGDDAFRQAHIEKLVFIGNLVAIGERAFQMAEIGTLALPAIASAGKDFLWGCNLRQVIYGGTTEEWKKLIAEEAWVSASDCEVKCTDGLLYYPGVGQEGYNAFLTEKTRELREKTLRLQEELQDKNLQISKSEALLKNVSERKKEYETIVQTREQ